MQKSAFPQATFLLVQYGAVLGGTRSVWGWYLVILGGTVRYFVVLDQYGAVLVGTWWQWVSIGWYWLVYDGTGSVEADTGRYLVVLGQ